MWYNKLMNRIKKSNEIAYKNVLSFNPFEFSATRYIKLSNVLILRVDLPKPETNENEFD